MSKSRKGYSNYHDYRVVFDVLQSSEPRHEKTNNVALGAPLNRFKPSRKYFTDRSKTVLLLWIFYGFSLSCVCYAFVRICLYVP